MEQADNLTEYEEKYQDLAGILRALSHPARLCIVQGLLKGEEICVSDLEKSLQISQPGVSQHLRRLSQSGLVEGERQGQQVFYRLSEGKREWLYTLLGEKKPRGRKKKRRA